MELEQLARERLLILQKEDKKMFVKWESGGDDRMLNFFVNEKEIKYNEDKLLNEFGNYIGDKINLHAVGPVYTKGKGLVYLDKNDQIYLKFDGLGYSYEEDILEDDLEDEILDVAIEISQKQIDYLTKIGLNNIHFYGSYSSIEAKQFSIDVKYVDEETILFCNNLQLQIEQWSSNYIKDKSKKIEVSYDGDINSDRIMINELGISHFHYTNKVKEYIISLFDEKAFFDFFITEQ